MKTLFYLFQFAILMTLIWRIQLYGGIELKQSLGFKIISTEPSRIITPNGDGINDIFTINFENPKDSFVSGAIYDVAGRNIGDMKLSSDGMKIYWNGRDLMENAVDAGSYIYQIRSPEYVYNGLVIVAR